MQDEFHDRMLHFPPWWQHIMGDALQGSEYTRKNKEVPVLPEYQELE